MNDTAVIDRSFDHFHPKARPAFVSLNEALVRAYKSGATKTLFKLFEGFRHPSRQVLLLGTGATKAAMFQSAHQYGLAGDFVPFDKKSGWSWVLKEGDLAIFHELVGLAGLSAPIGWDPLHVQHPLWDKIRRHVV